MSHPPSVPMHASHASCLTQGRLISKRRCLRAPRILVTFVNLKAGNSLINHSIMETQSTVDVLFYCYCFTIITVSYCLIFIQCVDA